MDEGAVVVGATVTDGAGTEIGKVSSAAQSPTLGKFVGLAMLKLAQTDAGSKLHIAGNPAHVLPH